MVVITSLPELLAHWPFLLEGLAVLRNPQGARGDISPETFFRICMHTVDKGMTYGLVALLTSTNDKPLGFGVMFENTEPGCQKSAIVYAVYSNKKYKHASKELLSFAEGWSRANDFKQIQACSRRFSGAAFQLFEQNWGFRRACVVFTKAV